MYHKWMDDNDQHISIDQSNDQSKEPPAGAAYLSAKEAAELLDVKLPTLYAYTSRGLIRSVPGERGRQRRYLRADLERLRARRDARSGHGPVAAAALRFGEPVLDSAITSLSPTQGPSYRGRLATDLAEADVPFELVAEHLWTDALPEPGSEAAARVDYLWGSRGLGVPADALRALLPDEVPPILAVSILVPLLASRDLGRFVQHADSLVPRARTLILRMAASLALGAAPERLDQALAADGVAAVTALALGAQHEADGVRALNRTLILVADHELNPSTFAARTAASTGADLYACVSAALATLSGPLHGGGADRIEAMLNEIGEPENAERVVHERARRGEAIEGFGHPLYPEGDPRAEALLQLARDLSPERRAVRTCLELARCLRESGGGEATVDMGLVAISAALGLPQGAASAIFAVGRSAGWVAHVLEQYTAAYMLRPRARYSAPR